MKGQVKKEDYTKQLKDADYKRVAEFEKNFKFKKKLQKEPRFGNCSIIQNPKTNQLIVVKEKRANDKKEAARLIMNARKLKTHLHPNILNLLDYSVQKHSELCSSFYIIKYFYQYPKSDLNREMKLRGRNQEGFSDVELTHLLYQQMHANEYLETQNMHHGDIRPLNIAYDQKKVHSQLIDQSETQPTARRTKDLQRNRLQNGHNLYQSPKMFSNLMKKNLNFQVDPSKEDVFANGLSLLEAGNGRSIQDIYDRKKGEVDQEALNRHLNDFRNKHGNDNTLLSSSLESMLATDEAERPNFKDLKANMPPYEEIKPFLDERTNNPNLNNNFQNNQPPKVKVQNAPQLEMYQPETREDIPLQIIPKKKTIVHAEAPKMNVLPPQEHVTMTHVQSPQPTYVKEVQKPQNYTTNIKHIYRRGNEELEPTVIREDRTSLMPVNNSHNTYNNTSMSTYQNTTVTEPIRESRIVYTQPQTVYTQAPQHNFVRTSEVVYQQPQTTNVVYTQPQTTNVVYSQPQTTNVDYSQPQTTYQNQIRRSVVVNQHTDTSNLKLVNTYEDSTNARNN